MSVLELQEELDYFEAHRSELVDHAEGKYALIKGEKLIDTFDTSENAYNEGVLRLGNVPFLIKKIASEDTVEALPAYTLGLMHVTI